MNPDPRISLITMESQTRLVIGIATHNRSTILAETIAFLAKQRRQPDEIFIAYADPADIADAPRLSRK